MPPFHTSAHLRARVLHKLVICYCSACFSNEFICFYQLRIKQLETSQAFRHSTHQVNSHGRYRNLGVDHEAGCSDYGVGRSLCESRIKQKQVSVSIVAVS